jgi:hypothetical protein
MGSTDAQDATNDPANSDQSTETHDGGDGGSSGGGGSGPIKFEDEENSFQFLSDLYHRYSNPDPFDRPNCATEETVAVCPPAPTSGAEANDCAFEEGQCRCMLNCTRQVRSFDTGCEWRYVTIRQSAAVDTVWCSLPGDEPWP